MYRTGRTGSGGDVQETSSQSPTGWCPGNRVLAYEGKNGDPRRVRVLDKVYKRLQDVHEIGAKLTVGWYSGNQSEACVHVYWVCKRRQPRSRNKRTG